MKKSLIFVSSFALALGVGVAVSAHQAKAQEAKADTVTTMYLDTNKLTWYGDQSRAYVYGTGGNNTWPGQPLTHVSGSIYKLDITNVSNYQSVIFLRSNGTDVWNRTSKDGGTAINLPADWTVANMFKFGDSWGGDEYGDGNYTGSWSLYTPPAVTYNVDVYVDGVKRGTEEIAKDELPVAPDNQYGKVFSGWCSDSACTTPLAGVTSTAPVYGKFTALPTINYSYSLAKAESGKFADVYLYAYDANGKSNAAWPGEKLSSTAFTVHQGDTIILNAGQDKEQTVNVAQLESPVANDVLRVLASKTDGKYNAVWESTVDEPASDGYYLVGSKTNNKYKNAPKMLAGEEVILGNDAEYYDYAGTKDETLKVRMFIGGQDSWSYFKENEYSTGIAEADEQGNLVFLKDEHIDIFAKWEEETPDNWQINFYISKHAERYNVSVTNVLFDGASKTGTEAGADQQATEGATFTPDPSLSKEGYVFRGYFTDANCTTAYVPAVLEGDTALYAKFTRDCYYLFGDATYMGEGHAWDIDAAHPVSAGTGDNRLVGTVVIPASASAEHPVKVKPLRWNGEMQPETYTLGEERTFVTIDEDGNFSFTEGGNYAFYIGGTQDNYNKVWFNIGEYAFHAKFLSEVGDTCNAQGQTDPEALVAVWGDMKKAFNALSDEDQSNIRNVEGGIDGGDEKSSDDRLKMIAKYSYIVHKYGTAMCEDFIWGGSYSASPFVANNTISSVEANNTMFVVIGAIFAVTLLGLTTCLVIKKRKQN